MKTSIHFSKFILVIAAAFFALQVSAKDVRNTITDSKVIKKSFNVNADAQFNLNSREADINITTWNQNKVEVTVTITVEAFEQEELDKMLKALVPNITGSSTNVTVEGPPYGQQETVIGNRRRIKMNNEVYKIKSYHFTYDIKMPTTNHVNLKNRFGKVLMDEHLGKMNLELYECKVQGSKINSIETTASLRFSDGSLGSAKALDLKIYEGDIILNQATTMSLDCKFSSLKILRVRDANLSAYESDVDLGVTNIVTAKQNFGKLKIAEAKTLTLTSYELEFESVSVDNFNMPSTKFSKINCGFAGNITVDEAYENRMIFGEIKSLKMEAKFSNVDIGKVEESVIATGYELRLLVADVSPNFSKLSFDGKFSNVKFKLSGKPGYTLKSSLNFGNLEFPKESLENLSVDKKGNQVNVSGKTSGYTGNASIDFSGYETDVTLSYN